MTSALESLARARRAPERTAVILSANPIHDTGGGQRSAQLALELLERGWAVVFVSHGVVTETVDLRLRYPQPGLVQWTLEQALEEDARRALLEALVHTRGLVITQVPVPEWLPVIRDAAEHDVATVYDCIDRWESELGRGWYRRDVEADIARGSERLMASAPVLVDHVEEITGRRTELLANAYNARLFDVDRKSELVRPTAFPEEGRVALYVGALWGGWMDWSLARAAAEAQPETTFVFVGDHRGEGRSLPANCLFTGLLPQSDLPAYLAHADVAFLPWRVDDVTVATSPLKVYEFVAMGLPVVAPDIEPLAGIPGVRTESSSTFVRAVGALDRATVESRELAEMRRFARDNSWTRRVDRLLEMADAPTPPARSRRSPAAIAVVIPAYNHERFVGEAVASVQRQSLPPAEIVVVDDGSTDGTAQVVARQSAPGLRMVGQENRGAHNALNRAIRLSRGDWVAILNSDDAWEPHRLEHAWAVCRQTGAALVMGSVTLVDEDGEPADPAHEIAGWYAEARRWAAEADSLRSVLARHNIGVTTSNFFFHRSLWRRLGGFRGYRYVHDYDFLMRALQMWPRHVVYEPELEGVRYRVHSANTITEGGVAQEERRELMASLRKQPARFRRMARGRLSRRRMADDVDASSILDPIAGTGVATGADVTTSEAGARPRVGLVVRSMGLGGLEEVVAVLAQGLPTVGVDASVACVEDGGAVARRLEDAGVDVSVMGGRLGRLTEWADDRAIVVANSHFAPVDAVHALSAHGVPVVETVQNCYAWLGAVGWSGERRRAEALEGVIAVSDTVSDYFAMHAGRASDWIVPNAVHPARVAAAPRGFARRTLGLPEGATVLAFVGRITDQKNPEGLLDAFSAACREAPQLVLVMAGPADGSVSMSALKRRHRELFRRGAIRHVASPPHVGTVLSAADGYVSNAFYEGWSVAASEAAWVGRPLFLSETGGSRALVGRDGERGVVVPNPCGDPMSVGPQSVKSVDPAVRQANVDALASALVSFAGDVHRWTGRGAAIRTWARATVAPDVMVRRYAEILLEVARRTPGQKA